MGIRLRNAPVAIVNLEFGMRIAADLASAIDRRLLGVEMPAGALRTPAFDIPATL